MRIQELGTDERPREKMIEKGAEALSNAELLAILIRTGTGKDNAVDVARNLLKAAGGSLVELSAMTFDRMKKVPGIGLLKAATVLSAIELGRRFSAEGYPYERIPVTNAGMLYRLLYPRLKGLDHEQCWVVFLNRSNYVINAEMVSDGGFSETTIDIKRILQHALDRKAAGMAVIHNHPSGNPRPGKADIEVTRRLRDAASVMGLILLDHVVFSDSSYFSFHDETVTLTGA